MTDYSTTQKILSYQWGMKYKPLQLEELYCVDSYQIQQLASEYGVEYSVFHISEKEFHEYTSKLLRAHHNYYREVEERKKDPLELCSAPYALFFFATILLIHFTDPFTDNILLNGLIIFLPFITPIPFAALTFPITSKMNKRIDRKFAEKYIGNRNRNVENFINEVMFQAYIRNRNIKVEYGYSLR